MVHSTLGLMLWLAILTLSINKNFGLDCSDICPQPDTVPVPKCEGAKIEPNYHETCKCFLGYSCCPHVCPQMNITCKRGLEITVIAEDCCMCNVTWCDSCPKRPNSKCQSGCEESITISDISDGCHYKSCKVVCPRSDRISCPNCQVPEVFTNSSFCGCTQQQCVSKLCPLKIELPPRECVLRKWVKTECGCDKQVYDEQHYCDKHNAVAAAKICKTCFKNEVLKGRSLCGCDKPQCIQISETCLQTFENQECPAGMVKQTGTTPCGVERDLCIKCDIIKFNIETCDSECDAIIESKDVNGCPIKRCEKKPCSNLLPQIGLYMEHIFFFKDKCGCLSYFNLSGSCKTEEKLLIESGYRGSLYNICDAKEAGGGWLTIQNRGMGSAEQLFENGDWNAYRDGFGSTAKGQDFWLGLKYVHQLTSVGKWQLLIKLHWRDGSQAGNWGWAVFDDLRVDDEAAEFKLNYGKTVDTQHMEGYGGTFDFSCANIYLSGTWYKDCYTLKIFKKHQRKDKSFLSSLRLESTETLMAIRKQR